MYLFPRIYVLVDFKKNIIIMILLQFLYSNKTRDIQNNLHLVQIQLLHVHFIFFSSCLSSVHFVVRPTLSETSSACCRFQVCQLGVISPCTSPTVWRTEDVNCENSSSTFGGDRGERLEIEQERERRKDMIIGSSCCQVRLQYVLAQFSTNSLKSLSVAAGCWQHLQWYTNAWISFCLIFLGSEI